MAPGNNTTQLSSNWKRLQETLAKEKKAAPAKDKEPPKREKELPQSAKRKRVNEPERKPAAKRNKNETPGQRRNTFRMEQSSEQKKIRKSRSTPQLKATKPSAGEEDDDEGEQLERPSSSNGIHDTSADGSSIPCPPRRSDIDLSFSSQD